jgi:two-component system sensor histidine kinase VicK
VPHHSVDFAAYFLAAPPTLLLKPDAPKFTILDVNPAYLKAVDASFEDLVGLGTLEAFPENPLDPHTQNVSTLRSSLTRVLKTKEQHILPSQKYDIPIRGTNKFETRYWKATNVPIVDGTGEVMYIAHVVLDITQAIEDTQKERFALELSEAKRKAIEQMEERLRLAIDSASLGTWYIDANTREFIVSSRFKELFGFAEHETITIDSALAQIDTAYHKTIIKGIEAAFNHQRIPDFEFQVLGHNDEQLRWLRSTGQLYAAQDDNRANFSGTIMDITKQKLDEQRKNDFIAMVSHELKTPLTSLNGYIQLLHIKIETSDSGFISNILAKATRQVAKMISMIDGFLNVSRLEAGRIHIEPTILNLALLIKGIENDNELSNSHNVIFNPIETTWVNVDRDKIELVITNLISNAIKYSAVNTKIQVSCIKKEDRQVIVSVSDQGIGVKPQDRAHLFDRFYRVESRQTASITGVGIGLYICKEIIERHGGKIWLESEFGTGSTFYFSLPLSH